MTNDAPFEYVDRATGARRTDRILHGGFLRWAYGTAPGWLLTQVLLKRRPFSELYGRLYRSRWSRRRIASFADSMGIVREDLVRPLEDYATFSDFFSREIDLRRRPIDPDPASAVAPADGRVLVYPSVGLDGEFAIKHGVFRLRRLLGDDALAAKFPRAAVAISRLYLADYHHFHFPVAGTPTAPRSVPGSYHAVSPYAHRGRVPFYAENHRNITSLESAVFGTVAMVEVGALTVGSIRQEFEPGVPAPKGGHKGWFELGGSIVVLVFREDAVRFDADLVGHSRGELETYVRVGESIGRSAG